MFKMFQENTNAKLRSWKFYPERFYDGAIKNYMDKCVCLAIVDNPRICLGKRFAITQSKAAIVEFIENPHYWSQRIYKC